MTPSPNQPLDALAEELEKAAKKSVDVFFENRSENTVAVFSARNILSLLAERKRDKAVIDEYERTLGRIKDANASAEAFLRSRVAKIRGGGE